MLTIPSNQHVIIYTDSQAAIDGIKDVTNSRTTGTKWFNTNNPTLKLLIKDCIDSKQLRITLIKVKGHSDDALNNIADRLAKEGLHGPILNLDFNVDNLFLI